MPWVRLHAIKDYLDMLTIIDKYPKIKLNFNIVPVLLDSIIDYTENNAQDVHSKLTLTPINKLTKSDKKFILDNFFDANYDNMILSYPYYAELYKKRYSVDEIGVNFFSDQEYADLMVYFNLCWIDPVWSEKYPEINYLKKKERNFSFEDRKLLIETHLKIMREIIPTYKKMQEDGRIEISTSPYYHPIMPLLIDIDSAKQTSVSGYLPENINSMKDDLEFQIKKALRRCKEIFGKTPKGIWPSEQSISQDTCDILAKIGVKWTIADEGVLSNSIHSEFIRDFRGYLEDPYDITQVYQYKPTDDKKLNLIFRDSVLPNLLSFEYPNHNQNMAANDFYERIKSVQDKLINSPAKNHLFTIAMDGENCWENYSNDGSTFLNTIYQLLNNDETIETVLVSEYIEKAKKTNVKEIAAGSWINRNFLLWVGELTKNLAWEYLSKTRDDVLAFQLTCKDKKLLAKIWNEVYIAEGSDWFWWYGEPNDSGQDHVFDYLFRSHLKNAYLFMNKEAPPHFDEPLSNIIDNYSRVPKRSITPDVDGKIKVDEWDYAGCINIPSGPVRAKKLYQKVCFGYDDTNLYLKFEVNKLVFDNYILNNEVEFYIYLINEDLATKIGGNLCTVSQADNISPILKNKFTHEIKISFCKDRKYPPRLSVSTEDGLWVVQLSNKILYAYDEVVEVKVPFDELNLHKGNSLKFLVVNAINGVTEEYYPHDALFATYRP